MGIADMSPPLRKKLLQMACVAAWTDLEVRPEEREVILDLAKQMGMQGKDLADVKKWLTQMPPDFDPFEIPREHKKAFFDAFLEVVTADGRIDESESETIRVLRELVS
jgi:uncharacterized tellurite resistance protein B-like protein